MTRSHSHDRRRRTVLGNRPGFALPLVILIIAVLTAALAASFAAASAEIGSNAAQRGQSRAFNIAESALELYLVARDSLCTSVPNARCIGNLSNDLTQSNVAVRADSLRVALPGGYAVIVAHQLRYELRDTVPAMYFIRSRGIDTASRMSGRDTTASQRTVGLVASWNTNTVNVLSAWTSLSGIQKNGTAGTVSGVDQCGKRADVAGISTPKGDYIKNGDWQAQGTPPTDTFSTLSQLEARSEIDWNSIINNNAIPADIEIPPSTFPDANWFLADTSRWPVIRIHTNGFALPNAGRGIIIADGDFSISGSNMWDGIILVGGKLTSDGNNTTAGATISGLNVLLKNAPQPQAGYVYDDASLNGQKNYLYDSCKVARASQRMHKFLPIANTWMDDVPTW
ncbi:MAG TPA: hypothetical protein VJU87_01135 [Gemmatimonadaceae bacterium]|nr:hypothetical protein [Gemmatimonadaceae bacterium]